VAARAAAAALGVSKETVEADVRRIYPLDCLIGAEHDGQVFVSAWELEGERLAAHRARLADGDSAAVISGAK
jgi:hypothetical protein